MRTFVGLWLAFLVFSIPNPASSAVTCAFDSNGNFACVAGSGTAAGACLNAICALGIQFIYIINVVLVPAIFALAFIVFLWGVYYYYIYGSGSEEWVKKGHMLVMYGIIGFVVMISIWGLVNVVGNTLGLGGQLRPTLPSSY